MDLCGAPAGAFLATAMLEPMKRLLLPLLLAGCQATGGPVITDIEGEGSSWNCTSRVELSSLWEALRARYDRDGDGEIPREDYPRGDVRFANFDRTQDGVLTAEDFPTDTHFNGFSHYVLGMADVDEDGELGQGEWWDFCEPWDENDDGLIVREELEESLGGWVDDWELFLLSFDQDSDGDFDRRDVHLTFVDQDFNGDGVLKGRELEGWTSPVERGDREGIAPGEDAPTFALGHAGDPGRVFRLEEAVRARPVALVFGSYT